MAPTLLYTICVLGAVAIYLALRPAERSVKITGAVLGLAAFAWFLLESVRFFAPGETGVRPETYYTIFSVIALASSLRMITHTRPVYCALYFVMVVLSSAGLFLLMAAEFLAFALIIVYAGAILVTYMFVLMLAQQAETGDATAQPEYDRVPREPAFAAVVGFFMLALMTKMAFQGIAELPPPPDAQTAMLQRMQELNTLPGTLEKVVQKIDPEAHPVFEDGSAVVVPDGSDVAFVRIATEADTQPRLVEIPFDAMPTNIQLVGLGLVEKFPVSLEMAGIILLLAMFGAAVLSRRQIELSEEELRQAAGLRRIASEHDHQEAEEQ